MQIEIAAKDFQTLKDNIKNHIQKLTTEQIDRDIQITQSIVNSITTYLDNYYRDIEQREYLRFTKDLARIRSNFVIWSNSSLITEIFELINTILEDLDVKKKKRDQLNKTTEIVHSDIHGQYTLQQLIKEYDKQVLTNTNQDNRISKYAEDLENEKLKNQQLRGEQTQLKEQIDVQTKAFNTYKVPKTLPGIIFLVFSFLFLSYVIGTIHYHLKLNFNPLIFFTIEALLLILGMIVWFKDGAERRNLVGQLIVGVFLILAGLVAYKLFT